MPYAHITGWGCAAPEKILTNADLEQIVDTTNEWILERTGIHERRIAREDESTASLGLKAAWRALEMANIKPGEIDLIICATSTPEYIFPATACIIQDKLGASRAGAFDLSAACSGFIYGLNMGSQAIRSEALQTVLVIGAETLSRVTNWQDRNTCVLFGDGAGAFVLQASDQPGGVLSAVMRSDGSGAGLLSVPAGGSKHPATVETVKAGMHTIRMDGREVFRFATRVMAQATREVAEAAGLTIQDLQWIVPHQANFRIIDAAARGLKLPIERFIINLEKYGNTSTASIPLAVCEAAADGRIKVGDRIVLVGFGAGLTWGALAAEWTGPLPDGHQRIRPAISRFWARIRSFFQRFGRFIEGLIWGHKA
ncbi:MAG: ketoacyl-ACP synthase III [Anaerolineales bacterium]|nr:ketoacyl-ACP synthase III [Anaerolineales bacterium]